MPAGGEVVSESFHSDLQWWARRRPYGYVLKLRNPSFIAAADTHSATAISAYPENRGS